MYCCAQTLAYLGTRQGRASRSFVPKVEKLARRSALPSGIQNDKGRYRARVTYKGKRTHIGSFHTIADARAALDIARSEIARGVFVPPAERKRQERELRQLEEHNALTIADLAESWLESYERAGRSKATIVTHRSALNAHVLPVLGDIFLTQLTADMIQTMLDNIGEPIPRRNAARTLQTMLNFAVKTKAGGLAASPFQYELPRPKNTRGRIDREKIATPEEIAALTAAMPQELALGVPLAAWCALRLGEVMGLERGDFEHLDQDSGTTMRVERQVNVKAGAITHPKAESYRTIAVPSFMVPMIRNHLNSHVSPEPSAPLFPGSGIGGRLSQSAFDRAWREARDKVKPGFRFHDLRHSGLTHFARAGATLAELMLRGGHTDVSVALRYQTATAERDRELTERMENMLTANES